MTGRLTPGTVLIVALVIAGMTWQGLPAWPFAAASVTYPGHITTWIGLQAQWVEARTNPPTLTSARRIALALNSFYGLGPDAPERADIMVVNDGDREWTPIAITFRSRDGLIVTVEAPSGGTCESSDGP